MGGDNKATRQCQSFHSFSAAQMKCRKSTAKKNERKEKLFFFQMNLKLTKCARRRCETSGSLWRKQRNVGKTVENPLGWLMRGGKMGDEGRWEAVGGGW